LKQWVLLFTITVAVEHVEGLFDGSALGLAELGSVAIERNALESPYARHPFSTYTQAPDLFSNQLLNSVLCLSQQPPEQQLKASQYRLFLVGFQG